MSEIVLKSGQIIRLNALNQSRTYEGLIEGLPNTELNKHIIDNVLIKAGHLWDGRPYLIEPREEIIALKEDHPFAKAAKIPEIQCVGRFRCLEAIANLDYSELTVVWFQNAFALPIDRGVKEQLVKLPWADYAKDYDFF